MSLSVCQANSGGQTRQNRTFFVLNSFSSSSGCAKKEKTKIKYEEEGEKIPGVEKLMLCLVFSPPLLLKGGATTAKSLRISYEDSFSLVFSPPRAVVAMMMLLLTASSTVRRHKKRECLTLSREIGVALKKRRNIVIVGDLFLLFYSRI